ncbi:tetratricopeptide repeat protein [Streptomyces sp. NPDC048281]|uniref:tetratricopeptide repeat protein n=1 Tax=Streptomyces sp. NPDC048281 TaxID=3154715 RepID=UPI003441396B
MEEEEVQDSWARFRQDLRALHEAVGKPPWSAVESCSGVPRSTANGYVQPGQGRVGDGSWDPVQKIITGLLAHGDAHSRTRHITVRQRDLAGWQSRWTALDVKGSGHRPTPHPADSQVRPHGVGMLAGWDGADDAVLSPEVTAEFATWAADHPHLDDLADIVARTGKTGLFRQAADLADALTSRTLTALGEAHPGTLAARHAHIYWSGKAGDIRSALDMTNTLYQDCLHHLGKDHALTLLALLRRAAWQNSNGQAPESRRSYATLANLTPSPPDKRFVLLARPGRAEALGACGQWEESRDQLAELRPDIVQTFGPHHPATLLTFRRHAHATGNAGQPRTAYELLMALAQTYAAHLDPFLPQVRGIRTDQVAWSWRVVPLEETVRQARALSADCSSQLGEEHPATLDAQHLLSLALYDTDLPQARTLLTTLSTVRERVQGADHPNTLATRSSLATAVHGMDGPTAALPLYRSVLAAQERVLGIDHPDTLQTRGNLTVAVYRMEGPATALPLWHALLAAQERILGTDHPDTLRTHNNLGHAIELTDGPAAAIPLYRDNLAARERVFGTDHHSTIRTRGQLQSALWEVEDEERGTE